MKGKLTLRRSPLFCVSFVSVALSFVITMNACVPMPAPTPKEEGRIIPKHEGSNEAQIPSQTQETGPTATDTIESDADTLQRAAKSALLEEPPAGIPFAPVGKFKSPIPDLKKDQQAWKTAWRLVVDDSFFSEMRGVRYNVWAVLFSKVEKSGMDVPHFLIGEGKTVRTITKEYGEPSFVGKFEVESGGILNVHWFGPIFIMAEGLDSTNRSIGGWPSKLVR